VLLEHLEVVVHLLALEAHTSREHRGRCRLSKLSQEPSTHWVERDLGDSRVVDDTDVEHATILSPTTFPVKERRLVG